MPRVGVHAIVVNELNHVLLVRKNYLDYDWVPPGGMMEDSESIPFAVQREVLEETGYVVETADLVAVASRAKTNDVIIVVAAKVADKTPAQGDSAEIAEIGFFPFDQLPMPMKPEVKKLLTLFRQGHRGQLVTI